MKKIMLFILFAGFAALIYPAKIISVHAKKDGSTIEYTLVHPLHSLKYLIYR